MHAFVEARRAAPAVLYLPHLELWWATAPASLRATLCMLLAELPPELPLLLLATAEVEPSALEPEARKLFAGHAVFQMGSPSDQQRRALFEPVVHAAVQPPAAHQAEQDAQVGCACRNGTHVHTHTLALGTRQGDATTVLTRLAHAVACLLTCHIHTLTEV